MSFAIAVSVFCVVANPDCCGPWRVSCSGRPEVSGPSSFMQRSTMSAATCAMPRPSASCAIARPGMWKLPVDAIELVSMSTRGLSAAALSSISTCSTACASASSAAPCTCATQRNDSGSWTRRAAPAFSSALPASALAQPPRSLGLPRRRASGLRPLRKRRQVRAKALERQRDDVVEPIEQLRKIVRARDTRCPTVAAFALTSTRPSLGPSATGARPARASASRPAIRRPSTKASPSPINTSAICESGGRSPTLIVPHAGTAG